MTRCVFLGRFGAGAIRFHLIFGCHAGIRIYGCAGVGALCKTGKGSKGREFRRGGSVEWRGVRVRRRIALLRIGGKPAKWIREA